jgi:glycosyltransferase A (GT-A) superfamily protein (DUF2064 family)
VTCELNSTGSPHEQDTVVRILVLAKSPVAGRSKTRLQQRWTPDQAAALAEAALADTLAAVAAVDARHEIVLDGVPGPWLPPGFTLTPQHDGTHAQRIAAAFAPHRQPCLLIGMDTPQVTADLLEDGLSALRRRQAVLGPAEDGGWWCLGLRTPAVHGHLVLDVPTSTSTTGSRQEQALLAAGLTLGRQPQLRDVDLPDDAWHVARLIPHSQFARVLQACEQAA